MVSGTTGGSSTSDDGLHAKSHALLYVPGLLMAHRVDVGMSAFPPLLEHKRTCSDMGDHGVGPLSNEDSVLRREQANEVDA